ncbi:MAG: hypothetical protein KC912_14170 [Proteobacteria bacterium]|nr:hypothetical protein [Pseudomonadota bacterium]
MDRTAAAALLLVAVVFAGVTVGVWLSPRALDPWRTLMTGDGQLHLSFDAPVEDMGLLVSDALHTALRVAAPMLTVVSGLTAVVAAAIHRPSRVLRPLVVWTPLVLVGTVSAVCLTPPDVVTTVLFFVGAHAVIVPVGGLALWLVGGCREVSAAGGE